MAADLAGITVVAVEQAVAAPYASGRLADAGARVIKVEPPEGDFARFYDRMVAGESAYFVWLNRGKESVRLNLRDNADHALLWRMVAKADIFIHNLRPGLLAAHGFDADRLRQADPRLITCEITGFGRDGPLSTLKAYDLIVQGEIGLCAITGNAAGPARVGVSICDIAAGVAAHAAILQALFARERTGRGRAVQVSLFDAIGDWMSVPLLQYIHAGYVTERAGVSHPSIAPYGAYPCADGVQLIFSVQNDREWVAFCADFLGRPELTRHDDYVDGAARNANRAALDNIVADRFAALTGAEAAALLQGIGIAWGHLNGIEQAAESPHLRCIHVDTPSGDVRVIAPAAIVDGETITARAVPALGAHDDEIRREFGLE